MSDDLVKRLRLHTWAGYAEKSTMKQAADRIEALEAAMAKANHESHYTFFGTTRN